MIKTRFSNIISFDSSKHELMTRLLLDTNENLNQKDISYRALMIYTNLSSEEVENFFISKEKELGKFTIVKDSISYTLDYYNDDGEFLDEINEEIDKGVQRFIEIDTFNYFIFDNCVIGVPLSSKLRKPSEKQLICYYRNDMHEKVKLLFNEFNAKFRLKLPEEKPGITIISQTSSGTDLNYIQFKDEVSIDLDKNYHDSIKAFDAEISTFITSNKSGLVLLHGQPGTGKTTYIRHLVNTHNNKKFIYVPNTHTHVLIEPSFMEFLFQEMDNSVIVIEEAERILESRESNSNNQYIAALLNTSDGIMGSLLNIKFICTFNGDYSKVDKALLRKGRLVGSYKFDALPIEKCQKILHEMGIDKEVDKPMTLAELYNIDKNQIMEGSINGNNSSIGFKR